MNGLIWSQSPVVTLICNLQRVIIGPRGCVKLHSVQISRNRQVQVNKENIGRSMWYFPHETLSVVSDQSLKTSWMLLHNGGCSIAYSSHFLCQLNLLPCIAGGAPLISLGSLKQAGFTLGRLESSLQRVLKLYASKICIQLTSIG